MEWLQGDAGNEDAVECGWQQPLEEDGDTFVSAMVSAFVSPEISYDEILILMILVTLGGAFVR